MTSVLAQQLAQLAAAQGPQARFIRGKPSLLYDYQKAADVGAETLLDIAQQGRHCCPGLLLALLLR